MSEYMLGCSRVESSVSKRLKKMIHLLKLHTKILGPQRGVMILSEEILFLFMLFLKILRRVRCVSKLCRQNLIV